jgi:PAP2 superfamily protein
MNGEIQHVGREVRHAIAKKLGSSRDPASEDFMELANPWGSMPSDAIGAAVVTARSLARISPAASAVAWGCTGVLAFTVVYLGEHYVVDVTVWHWPKPSGRPSRRCCRSMRRAGHAAQARAARELTGHLASPCPSTRGKTSRARVAKRA